MAKVTRNTRLKKSVKAALPRRAKTGIAAAPQKSFRDFSSYVRMDVEKKEVAGIIRNWIRSNFKGEEKDLLLAGPEYCYTSHHGVASTIYWKTLGHEWPDNWDGQRALSKYVDYVKDLAMKKLEAKKDSDKVVVNKKSPMDIVKDKTSDFIAQVEEVIDMFDTKTNVDWDNYSVYNEMIKSDLNSFSAKHVVDYYLPLKAELEELVNKKPDDLVEAYSHLSIPKRKKLLAIVSQIVDDSNKYLLSKKATRKPSKPRVKTADKQVMKLNYAKESSEYKLTSINPMQIIGAVRLYTFNVKERIITEFITRSSKGFEVSGSTLKLFDEDRSRSIRLRKPDESLTVFLTKNVNQINKHWDSLTTKSVKPTGRINKDTILLRVMNS